jgi:hypothetical protein
MSLCIHLNNLWTTETTRFNMKVMPPGVSLLITSSIMHGSSQITDVRVIRHHTEKFKTFSLRKLVSGHLDDVK